jgi:hypothetical protein
LEKYVVKYTLPSPAALVWARAFPHTTARKLRDNNTPSFFIADLLIRVLPALGEGEIRIPAMTFNH